MATVHLVNQYAGKFEGEICSLVCNVKLAEGEDATPQRYDKDKKKSYPICEVAGPAMLRKLRFSVREPKDAKDGAWVTCDALVPQEVKTQVLQLAGFDAQGRAVAAEVSSSGGR